ncbi:MAG: 3-oxoacyl-[acyl-carrier-protein] reductase [Kiritimatiellae bacterium]|nr:3-oxoacyl-[acyl-carrier-protein] reductase [Kiritimatiellia bacterium]
MGTLEGRVAIVTGASRGIGAAIVKKLADEGAKVVACARSIESCDGAALCLKVDVSDAAQVDACVKEAVAKFGRVDILVNNAGITKDGLLMRMSDDDWDKVIDINLKGTFLFTRAVSRPMMKNKGGDGLPAGGAIVNIASVVGITGNAGQANYTASKGGVIALTKTVAKELGSRQIRCNAVAPGFIRSQMTDVLPDEVKKQYAETIPLRRFGEAGDVADAVAWLASDAAAYVTGQVIGVNGGMV